jgi:hypothetical protein
VFCAWPFVLSACSCSGSRSYFCLHRNPLEPIFNFHLCVQECAVRSDYCWILLCDKYSSARSRSVAGLCLDLGTLNSFFCRRFVGHDTARPGVFFVAAPTGIFFRSARQFSSALTGSCCRKTIPLSDLFGANSVCPVSWPRAPGAFLLFWLFTAESEAFLLLACLKDLAYWYSPRSDSLLGQVLLPFCCSILASLFHQSEVHTVPSFLLHCSSANSSFDFFFRVLVCGLLQVEVGIVF